MKLFYAFFIMTLLANFGFSQSAVPSPTPTRPRVVVASTPTPQRVIIVSNNIPPAPTPTPSSAATPRPQTLPSPMSNTQIQAAPLSYNGQFLSFGQIRARLEEAKRAMAARPITISDTDGTFTMNTVRVAFFDWDTRKIDYIVLPKDSFLTKNGEFFVTSAAARSFKIRIVRPNGVNTPVLITDYTNRSHLPLMVQYPVERKGIYHETAYYMSTHPGLVTTEVVNAGKVYVRNTIDVAREKLRQKGIIIAPHIADMAERLSIVEHVDHYRFRTEPHQNIYGDIFTLYALNEGQTYRYSVSSAGAGGMIQMIPATYASIRRRFYNVGLLPDFVEGMRNHPNAAQAMLLYIQTTFDDLMVSPTVANALATGVATEGELLSAGYNSNPAKLAGYIKRGGAGWKYLIPRETQIYLQINDSLNRWVPYTPRTR